MSAFNPQDKRKNSEKYIDAEVQETLTPVVLDEEKLTWKEEKRSKIFECNVFSVWELYSSAPISQPAKKKTGKYSVIEAKDWAIIIPVYHGTKGRQFVMVWQWRHGSQSLSLEFPGGIFEPGENPDEAAARELQEETGYKAGIIKKIGEFSPNPAIMSNRVHFFCAENLIDTGQQNLDDDEYLEVALVDIDEVCRNAGQPPYIHALMGSALALFYKEEKKRSVNEGRVLNSP